MCCASKILTTRNSVKRIIHILLLMAFTLGARDALSQKKSDFSDWNVPPPIPPGSIQKGRAVDKNIHIQLPVDVAVPDLQFNADLKFITIVQVSKASPDVAAPEQPLFPGMPFRVDEIPSPAIPKALDLPKDAPQDEVNEDITGMPSPKAPEMPDLPKMPVVTEGQSNGVPSRLPVVPSILKQPVPELTGGTTFPFTEWPAPPIPLTVHFTIVLEDKPENKLKPDPIKKSKRKRQRNK